MRRNVIALIKNKRLSITIKVIPFEKYFLNVALNLVTGKSFPLRKPNNQPFYINAKSNHQKTMIRYLPNMINKRLLDLSCNEEEYGKQKPFYKTALNESGCKTTTTNHRNRVRYII